jgi:hypothetical protein
MAEKSRSGKKGRKIGRQENKPCHKRYNAEKRWEKNKLRRAKKTARRFGYPVWIKYSGQMMEVKA